MQILKNNPEYKLPGEIRFELNKLTLDNFKSVQQKLEEFITPDSKRIPELVEECVRKRCLLAK
jgi:hypothetical protein